MRRVGTKGAAKVQNPVLNTQLKQAHEIWNYLKAAGTDAMWSCAQRNPQVRAGMQAALPLFHLTHFLVGKSEFHRTRLFQRENDKLMRCYNFSIRWIETKNSFWHWYVLTLWFDWKCPFCCDRFHFHFSLSWFFFCLVNTPISCPALNEEHSRHSQKNKLFLARLVVHSHCHVRGYSACDVRPCHLVLCYILVVTYLTILLLLENKTVAKFGPTASLEPKFYCV